MPKRKSIFQHIYNIPYGYTNSFHLFDATKNSKDILQKLRLQVKIPAHNGCVNSICWNESGKLLLSGSDDEHLSITDAYSHSILGYILTGHRSNIFSAKFLPNSSDHKVVSCSGDGVIIYSDLEIPETSLENKLNCHFGTAYEIMTIHNDPNTFLSCGEDGTVRWYDLRIKTSCVKDNCTEDILIKCNTGVTSLSINPITPYQLAIGCADSSVRVFDRRMLGTEATGYTENKKDTAMLVNFTTPQFSHSTFRRRITSLCYSRDGQEMLVSYSSDFVYLFDLRNSFKGSKDPKVLSTSRIIKTKNGQSVSPSRPLMKRLRVRGDWSDTGPQARPECETRGLADTTQRSVHANLMQRMSDVLTTMYHQRAQQENAADPSSTSHSDDSDEENPTPGDQPTSDNSENISSHLPHQIEPPENLSDHTYSAEQQVDNDQNPSSSSMRNISDFTFTTIRVTPSPPVDNQMDFSEPQNVSLQIIKQEMGCPPDAANSEQSEVSVENSDVVYNPSDSPLSSVDVNSSQSTSHTPPVCNEHETPLKTPSENETSLKTTNEHETLPKTPNENDITTQNAFNPVENVSSLEDVQPAADSGNSVNVPSEPERLNMPVETEDMGLLFQHDESSKDTDEDEFDTFVQPEVIQRFTGHRNARTMIKESTFWGDDFVMSGSDCGHIFIWDRHSAELVMLMEADHHVVNCLQPHPYDPILASSGIDYDIKIWAPLLEEPFFDKEKALEIIQRNRVMLEETKDTITVPASFMIRMLASLNAMTTGTGWRRIARQLREEYRNRRN